jgi:hypothetical protein
MPSFVRIGRRLVSTAAITSVDTDRIEDLEVTVRHQGGIDVASGIDAIEVVMALRPSALEGRRLRFARRAWAVHNLVGHPLMQALAWLGLRELGLWVHDATVPKPRSP